MFKVFPSCLILNPMSKQILCVSLHSLIMKVDCSGKSGKLLCFIESPSLLENESALKGEQQSNIES